MDLALASVTERDLDLLLFEEFVASPEFALWFVNRVGGFDLSEHPVISASRSVTTASGESDLEVALTTADGSIHYLPVENKISASFQPRQAGSPSEASSMTNWDNGSNTCAGS